jgi:hypothetical protein
MSSDLRVKDQLRYRAAVAITPADVVIPCTNAIYVGTTCNLQVLFVDDDAPVTLPNVVGGREYRLMVIKILAGTDIVALY